MKAIICNDIIGTLEKIMLGNTEAYQKDFELDRKILTEAAKESPCTYLWMSRRCGTYCLPEREVFIKNTLCNAIWQAYTDPREDHHVKAYAVEVSGMENDCVKGTLYELDYPAHCKTVATESVKADKRKVSYEKGDVYQPIKEYVNRTSDKNLGEYLNECIVPNDNDLLEFVLRNQYKERHSGKRKISLKKAR